MENVRWTLGRTAAGTALDQPGQGDGSGIVQGGRYPKIATSFVRLGWRL